MKIIKFSPRMKNKFNCIDFWDRFTPYIKRPYSILNREATFNNNSGVHWGIITHDIYEKKTCAYSIWIFLLFNLLFISPTSH